MSGRYERQPHLLRLGGAYVADNATVVGQVTLEDEVSVWYGTVIRGDVATIKVGRRTNVQDLCMIHPQTDEDVVIGADNSFGHGAIFHGRTMGDRCLLGMRATVLRGAIIGSDCLLAAGCVVTEGTVIPDRSVVMGTPGRVVRRVTEEEMEGFQTMAGYYLSLAQRHLPADA